MISFDKSVLKPEYREAEVDQKLIDFADLVGLAKPRVNFTVDNECVSKEYSADTTKHFIRKLRVFEDGEELGDIGVTRRYNRSGTEFVYIVRSFRIRKERGDRNGTMARDIKVALRHAKKVLMSRESNELIEQVKGKVNSFLDYAESTAEQGVRWCIPMNDLAVSLAIRAYHAKSEGQQTITINVDELRGNGKKENYDARCDNFMTLKHLNDKRKAKSGYGIFARVDESLIVYSYATETVKRYDGFTDLPREIQEKYAMFKVISKDEPHDNIGCKFDEGYAYVVE